MLILYTYLIMIAAVNIYNLYKYNCNVIVIGNMLSSPNRD